MQESPNAVFLAISAVAIGYALQVSNSLLQDDAIVALSVAVMFVIAGVALPPIAALERFGEKAPVAVIAAGLLLQFGLLLGRPPGVHLEIGLREYATFQIGLGVAAVLAGLLFTSLKWTRRVVFPLLVVMHFLLGLWMLKSSPDPSIDVVVFHREAFASLENGGNPHTGSIPNLYGAASFYGPDVVQNNRVQIGYPYPPLSLFLTFVAQKLTGDYRSLLLVAMSIAASAIAYSRSSRISFGAAALFLFTPRTFFVLEQGWTDALAAMLFCVTVFVACRRPRLLWVAVGLFFAIKQYAIGVLPLLFMLWPERSWKTIATDIAKSIALAAALTLPMFLWNPGAFMKDVVLFQIRQPFRIDALSYLAFLAKRTGTVLGSWVGFLALVPAAALGIWRAPRTPAGFAAASSLLFLAFVALNKQAFCNYYYFVIALLATAVGTVQPRLRTD